VESTSKLAYTKPAAPHHGASKTREGSENADEAALPPSSPLKVLTGVDEEEAKALCCTTGNCPGVLHTQASPDQIVVPSWDQENPTFESGCNNADSHSLSDQQSVSPTASTSSVTIADTELPAAYHWGTAQEHQEISVDATNSTTEPLPADFFLEEVESCCSTSVAGNDTSIPLPCPIEVSAGQSETSQKNPATIESEYDATDLLPHSLSATFSRSDKNGVNHLLCNASEENEATEGAWLLPIQETESARNESNISIEGTRWLQQQSSIVPCYKEPHADLLLGNLPQKPPPTVLFLFLFGSTQGVQDSSSSESHTNDHQSPNEPSDEINNSVAEETNPPEVEAGGGVVEHRWEEAEAYGDDSPGEPTKGRHQHTAAGSGNMEGMEEAVQASPDVEPEPPTLSVHRPPTLPLQHSATALLCQPTPEQMAKMTPHEPRVSLGLPYIPFPTGEQPTSSTTETLNVCNTIPMEERPFMTKLYQDMRQKGVRPLPFVTHGGMPLEVYLEQALQNGNFLFAVEVLQHLVNCLRLCYSCGTSFLLRKSKNRAIVGKTFQTMIFVSILQIGTIFMRTWIHVSWW
jgi:hypothetical protein